VNVSCEVLPWATVALADAEASDKVGGESFTVTGKVEVAA
jgi:hypothetical protein